MTGVGEITKADLPNRVLAYPRCVKTCIYTLQPSGGHRQRTSPNSCAWRPRASSLRPQRSFCGDLGRHPERRQRADAQKWQSLVQSLPPATLRQPTTAMSARRTTPDSTSTRLFPTSIRRAIIRLIAHRTGVPKSRYKSERDCNRQRRCSREPRPTQTRRTCSSLDS